MTRRSLSKEPQYSYFNFALIFRSYEEEKQMRKQLGGEIIKKNVEKFNFVLKHFAHITLHIHILC